MSDRARKAIAKVVLLTKDEHVLVEDFIRYYGALFGYENVVVIDNNSTDDRVLEVYSRYSREHGVEVRTEIRPFNQAVSFMTEHMLSIRASCEWMLPLETDEFVFNIQAQQDEGHVLSRDEVASYLSGVPESVSIIRYGAFYGSVVDTADPMYDAVMGVQREPLRQITSFYDQNWDKIIVRSREFEKMVQWCHHAQASSGAKVQSDVLGLLHYHDVGFKRKIDSAVRVIDSYEYLNRHAVDIYRQHNLCRNLIRSKVSCGHKIEYYDTYLRRLITLLTFRNHIGRLPRDAAELNLYADQDDPARAVLTAQGIRSEGISSPPDQASTEWPTWNALLYHEPRESPRQHLSVRQVSNFFMSKGPLSLSGALKRFAADAEHTSTVRDDEKALLSDMYDSIIGRPYMGRRGLKALGVGISTGATVAALATHFGEAAVVIGIGTKIDCVKAGAGERNVSYIEGDATSAELADAIGTSFDIIVDDDPNRRPEDQLSAMHAFVKYVAPGGVYVVKAGDGEAFTAAFKSAIEVICVRYGLRARWHTLLRARASGHADDVEACLHIAVSLFKGGDTIIGDEVVERATDRNAVRV